MHCEHSERVSIKKERLEKLAIAAMKQSQQAWLPKIRDMVSFEEIISVSTTIQQKFIAHCSEGEKHPLQKKITPGGDILILIGPEGDFSPGEIDAALKAGFIPVTLGETRLRTETAALVAVVAGHFANAG